MFLGYNFIYISLVYVRILLNIRVGFKVLAIYTSSYQ